MVSALYIGLSDTPGPTSFLTANIGILLEGAVSTTCVTNVALNTYAGPAISIARFTNL